MLDLITKAGSGFAIFCLVACIFTFARLRFVEILLVVYLHQLESCILFYIISYNDTKTFVSRIINLP